MFEACLKSIDVPNKAEHMRLFEKEVFRVSKENPDASSSEVVAMALREYSTKQRQALKAKELRAVKSAMSLETIQKYVAEQSKTTATKNEAVARLLVTRRDGRSIAASVEAKSRGIYGLHAAPIVYKLAQRLNSKLAGWGISGKDELEILKGLRGENNDAMAKEISEAFTQFRDRAVKAGAEIGLLENWGNPQAWDAYKADKYTKDEFVNDFFEVADRDAYANHLGKVMTDEELRAYIAESRLSIITDGENKAAPKRGTSGMSRMMAAERQLFIKGAEGFQKLNDKYGAKTTLELIDGHFQSMGKLISFLETFGPTGDKVVEKVLNDNVQEASRSGGDYKKERRMADLAMAEMNAMMGQARVQDMGLNRMFSGLRNLSVLKLGSASISSMADNGNIIASAAFGEGSPIRFYQNRIAQMKDPKAAKFAAVQAGIAADVIYHNAYKSTADMLDRGWTGAAASATNTLSFLNMLTRTRKEAFREMRLHALTEVVRREPSMPDDLNGKIMKGHGITEADYQAYRQAALKNEGTLTPRAVMEIDQAAAEKLASMTIMETASGVVEQSGWVRLVTGRGKNVKGTWLGELAESFWMFKGYPINIIYRSIDGYRLRGGLNGAAYVAASTLLTTVFGALAIQFSDLTKGKNPRNVEDSKFWLAAMMKGGSLGVFGDFLYAKERFGKSAVETAMGPVIGDAITALDIAKKGATLAFAENPEEDAKDFAGNLLRLLRTNTPLVGLWYTGAAVDHAFTYQAQDMLSPGYTKRMEKRAQKEFGQSYWWSPQKVIPDEAPNFEEIKQ